MDIADIIAAGGGASKLGKTIGCHHSSILEWRRVPEARLEAVARATGISVHDLRPDLARLFATPPGAPSTEAAA